MTLSWIESSLWSLCDYMTPPRFFSHFSWLEGTLPNFLEKQNSYLDQLFIISSSYSDKSLSSTNKIKYFFPYNICVKIEFYSFARIIWRVFITSTYYTSLYPLSFGKRWRFTTKDYSLLPFKERREARKEWRGSEMWFPNIG